MPKFERRPTLGTNGQYFIDGHEVSPDVWDRELRHYYGPWPTEEERARAAVPFVEAYKAGAISREAFESGLRNTEHEQAIREALQPVLELLERYREFGASVRLAVSDRQLSPEAALEAIAKAFNPIEDDWTRWTLARLSPEKEQP